VEIAVTDFSSAATPIRSVLVVEDEFNVEQLEMELRSIVDEPAAPVAEKNGGWRNDAAQDHLTANPQERRETPPNRNTARRTEAALLL